MTDRVGNIAAGLAILGIMSTAMFFSIRASKRWGAREQAMRNHKAQVEGALWRVANAALDVVKHDKPNDALLDAVNALGELASKKP